MTIYDRIMKILYNFKVYDISNDFLQAEISAYSYALDTILNELLEMEREAFVHTAIDYGITEKEHYYDRGTNGMTLSERKERLIKMMTIGEKDFTKGALESFLATYSAQLSVRENPFTNTIEIVAEDSSWVQNNIDFLKVSIGKFLPAHLDFTLTVG